MKEVDFKVDGIKYVGWDSFTPDEADALCNSYGLPHGIVKSTSGYGPYAGLAMVNGNYAKTPGILPNTPAVTNNSYYKGNIVIPPTVVYNDKNYLVVEIGTRAFYNALDVRSVTLPDSIRRIAVSAFMGCIHISRINFPQELSSIGNGAFWLCDSLVKVVLPDNLSELQYGTILFPGNKKGGNYGIFTQCKNLEDLTIGSGMRKMDHAFSLCDALKTVVCKATIPPVITEMTFENKAYQNATLYVPFSSLEAYKRDSMWGKFSNIRAFSYDFVVNGLYYKITDKNNVCVVAGDNKGLYSNAVTIPNQVTHIYKGYKDGKLVEYSNTYKVTSIEEMAFADCNDLTEVVFDDTIISVGFKAFANCPNLTNVFCGINLPAADNTVFMNSPKAQFVQKKLSKGDCIYLNGIFYRIETMENDINEVSVSKDRWNTLGSHEYKGHVTIPQTVNYAAKTFNVIYIDSFAFARCKELTGVTLPPKMWKIRNRAFLEAKNLKSITFGSYVVAIQNSAFDSCESLSEITFLDGMLREKREKRTLHIYPNAFTNCKNLKRIVCERMTPPKIEDQNAFDQDVYDNATLVLKACDKEAYLNDPIWKRFQHTEYV